MPHYEYISTVQATFVCCWPTSEVSNIAHVKTRICRQKKIHGRVFRAEHSKRRARHNGLYGYFRDTTHVLLALSLQSGIYMVYAPCRFRISLCKCECEKMHIHTPCRICFRTIQSAYNQIIVARMLLWRRRFKTFVLCNCCAHLRLV